MTRFQRLTLATAAMTYLLVVIGATVRGTGSGLGCIDWPLCNGNVIPPLGDTPAWIEWIHRGVAAVLGLMVLAVAVVAVRHYRDRRSIVVPAVAALGLTIAQAVLGKITVESGNSGESVTAHLAAAMVLLALLTAIAIRTRYPAHLPRPGASQRFTLLAAFTSAAVFALLMFGAHVTATRASLVFPDWPLFGGSLIPRFSDDPALASMQMTHFLHRAAAAVVAVIVAVTAWVAWRGATGRGALWVPGAGSSDANGERSAPLRGAPAQTLLALTGTAAALYAVQVVVGGLQIFTTLAAWAVSLHLALGAAIWALLVAATAVSYCEARVRGAGSTDISGGRERATPTAARGSADDGLTAPGSAAVVVSSRADKVRAYVALTKPRIIELLLVTTIPAMVLAARGAGLDLGWWAVTLFWTLLGGSLAAGAANAINQYLEQDIDQLMSRTRRRPLPAHRVDPEDALVFGLVLGVVAFAQLAITVNLLAAFLTLLAMAFYVVVYTIMLKRSTPQNIVIGGAAGALPPVIGWAAVTNDISLPAVILFALVFYWTPPHFWALSMRLAKDYRAAGVPMLPVVRGIPETTRQIALYSVLMVALSLVFFAAAGMGLVYLAGAVVLGAVFLYQAFAMWREGTDRRAVRLYKYSISYLTALFALIAVDVVVPLGL